MRTQTFCTPDKGLAEKIKASLLTDLYLVRFDTFSEMGFTVYILKTNATKRWLQKLEREFSHHD